MQIRTRSIALLVSLAFFPLLVQAAEPSSHEVAARRLVQACGGTENVEAGAEAMMGMIRDNPELAPYEDVFRAWYKKVFSTGDLEGELARVYMKYFTEQELRDLTAFYGTPLGRKAIGTLPQVMKEGAEIGMARAKEHESELTQMLDAAKAERQKQTAKPPK
jgi:uncharacterized protein